MKQEAGAGKMTWDVVEGPEDAFYGFVQSKYVQPYASAAAASFPTPADTAPYVGHASGC